MKRLNKILYGRLVLQAEEASEFGMIKLAQKTMEALPESPREEEDNDVYSFSELSDDIYGDIWKMAVKVLDHHDLEHVDIMNLDEFVKEMSEEFIDKLQEHLGLKNKVGKRDDQTPGEHDETVEVE